MTKTWIRKVVAAAGCAALVFALNVGVSYAASATANTSARVVAALAITKSQDLNFGKFMPGTNGGTVVVSTAGAQSVTGDLTTTTGLGSTAAAATFSITGEANATYAITYPATTTLTGGGSPMSIGGFTNAVDTGSVSLGVGTLPASGPQALSVGATLTVGANQTAGTYGGTLEVAVNYN